MELVVSREEDKIVINFSGEPEQIVSKIFDSISEGLRNLNGEPSQDKEILERLAELDEPLRILAMSIAKPTVADPKTAEFYTGMAAGSLRNYCSFGRTLKKKGKSYREILEAPAFIEGIHFWKAGKYLRYNLPLVEHWQETCLSAEKKIDDHLRRIEKDPRTRKTK